MKDTQTYYVGFSTLEGLLEVHKPNKPLYVAVLRQITSSSTMGVTRHRIYAIVSDFSNDECHFWTMTLWKVEYIDDQPFGLKLNAEQLQARAHEVEDLLAESIKQRIGIAPRLGGVSLPTNMDHIPGQTQLITFDKKAHRFVLSTEASAQPRGAGAEPSPEGNAT